MTLTVLVVDAEHSKYAVNAVERNLGYLTIESSVEDAELGGINALLINPYIAGFVGNKG